MSCVSQRLRKTNVALHLGSLFTTTSVVAELPDNSSEAEGATVAAVRSDLTLNPSPPPNPPVQVPIYNAY